MRFEGKVALFTGTAGGIGRAAVLRFAEEAVAVFADVSDDAAVACAVKTAEQVYGRLDIAFNNAGIMLADDSDSIATSEETIDKTLAVNLKGVLYGCWHQIPAMRMKQMSCRLSRGRRRSPSGSVPAALAF